MHQTKACFIESRRQSHLHDGDLHVQLHLAQDCNFVSILGHTSIGSSFGTPGMAGSLLPEPHLLGAHTVRLDPFHPEDGLVDRC